MFKRVFLVLLSTAMILSMLPVITINAASTVYGGTDYSLVYNHNYYINKYADIKMAFGNNPDATLRHFVIHGMGEGRQGNEVFSLSAYKNRYPDLKLAFGNNNKSYYHHYIQYGKNEGRLATGNTATSDGTTVYDGINYSSVYNHNYYISKYPDIKSAFGDNTMKALEHFVKFGMSEGRQGSEGFNLLSYKNRYQDLRQAFGYDNKKYYLHYLQHGKNEGRLSTGDTTITDGITVYGGVNYSSVYNYNYYITKYVDIKSAFGNDDIKVLEHFVKFGMSEGRQGNDSFNVTYYKNSNYDLRQAFGNNLKAYYLHFINYGKRENRSGIGTITYKGIDVSRWQGTINWPVLKDEGIHFAMIKASYGSEPGQVDPYFAYNITEARKAGIKVGVYHYSYAQTVEEAILEANHFLDVIRPYGALDYPITLDFELDSRRQTALKEHNTEIIIAFCETIKAAGYTPMVYADVYMLTHYIDYNRIKQYEIWAAEWRDTLSFPYPVSIWQYSDRGTIKGINAWVDLNLSFKDY